MRWVLGVLLAGCATSALAGAWTIERGETRTYVTSTFTYGDHGFDENGDLVTVPEYQKMTLSAALEYGLRPWLTAVVAGELTDESIETEVSPTLIASQSQTFASVAGGARVRLYQGPFWVASTQITALSGGFTTAGDGKPSDGPAVEIRALGGVSGTVLGKPVYADAQAAYRKRFDADQPDEVKLDLTVGAKVLPKWDVIAQSFSTFEVGGDASHHKLSAMVVRQVTDNLRVGVGGIATVAGRSAVQELGGHVDFWWVMPKKKPVAVAEAEARLAAHTAEQKSLQSIFK